MQKKSNQNGNKERKSAIRMDVTHKRKQKTWRNKKSWYLAKFNGQDLTKKIFKKKYLLS